MESTTQTPLVIAGRPPSFAERQYWQRLHSGLRRAAVWLMAGITAYFAYSAWVTVFYMTFWEAIITAAVLIVPTVLMLWFPLYDGHQRENALKTAWYNEQADKLCLSAGYTVTLWDDCVVKTDLRGETTVPFARVTLCTETIHGFYLQAGTTDVLIRSADLTTEQVTTLRARLQTALPRERYRQKSPAIACLREALPIPAFQNDDVVVARAAVNMPSSRNRKRLDMARMFAAPAGVIYGAMVAQTVTVTAYYLLDLLILCAVGAALLYGLLFVLSAKAKGDVKTVHLALTRDGVASFCGGQHFFLAWERIKVEHRYYSMRMYFPGGDRLRIAYAQFDDPEAVRQIG